MQPWTVEHGTFWALPAGSELPPLLPAPPGVEFVELGLAAAAELTAAMDQPSPAPILARLQNGRRCFALLAEGEIATFGWVTCGLEQVGELERQFNLHSDEAYIWDCGTRPAWRRRGFYAILLSRIIHQLRADGVPLIWIGASRLNQPSVRGIANAGFQPVLDITYRRIFRLTLLWLHSAPAENRPLVTEAYRILLNKHERRFGRLAIGWKT